MFLCRLFRFVVWFDDWTDQQIVKNNNKFVTALESQIFYLQFAFIILMNQTIIYIII